MFSVNDKVVLVDDKWPDFVPRIYAALPKLNETYVIRATRAGVEADSLLNDMRRVMAQSVLLVGVVNGTNKLGVEFGFDSKRFRKLDEIQAANAERVGEVVERKNLCPSK